MTVSPDATPLQATNLADAVAALRQRGLRLSTARRLVLEALFAADGPVSAEYLARRLDLDAASVHRNFEMLERHGLVRHVHLGHGPGLYTLLGRGEREYLYCDRCGAVRALPPKELDPVRRRIRERYGYETRFDHFALVGTCEECSAYLARGMRSRSSTQRGRAMIDEPHAHGRHEHEHSHGDHVHAHSHVHQEGPEERHEHGH